MSDAPASRPGLRAAAALLAAGALFLAANAFVRNAAPDARLDLTEDSLYTLSDGTRAVLAELKEPVTLTLFFSDRLGREVPAYGTYFRRVRDLLTGYAAVAGPKLQIDVLRPEPFSPEEDRAVAAGLQGVPVDQSGERVYFGLIGSNTVDDVEVVPFLQPEREAFLDYELTQMIYKLSTAERPVVGVLSPVLPFRGGLPPGAGFGGGARPLPAFTVSEQLDEVFDTRSIGADVTEVPADVTVLLLIHPQDLSDRTLYAVDQFVLRGGRLAVFVDPHAELQPQAPQMPGMPPGAGPTSSDLAPLFAQWGLRFDPDMAVGDRIGARRVSTGSASGPDGIDYVAWLALRGGVHMNPEDAVTAELDVVAAAGAGAVFPTEDAADTIAEWRFTPLLFSSTEAMVFPADKIRQAPDPKALLDDFEPEGIPFALAARVTGRFASAFPDGPPPPPEDVDDAAETPPGADPADHLAEAEAAATVVVVADTDLLQDSFWVTVQNFFGQRIATPTAENGDFVVNLAESLTGTGRLIALRSRGGADRPFTLVEEMQRDADDRFRAEEARLLEEIEAVEAKLADVQQGDGSEQVVLSAEEEGILDGFRTDMLALRGRLREVQRALRSEIDALETRMEIAGIAAVPALVILIALAQAARAARRRRRAVRTV